MKRSEAKSLDLKTYRTGSLCKNGHDAERYTTTGNCVECNRVRNRIEAKVRYYKEPDVWRARAKKWQSENPEKAAASRRSWKLRNADHVKEYQTKWSLANPGYFTLKATERLSYVQQATPKWADKEAIADFYAKRPEGFHVDHFYPLRGRTVCGLHTVENFQYLIQQANQQKSNKEPEI